MDSTAPNSNPERQLFEQDVALLQDIVKIYHARLMAAWATLFRGEAIPPGHGEAPDITSWAPSKISKILLNFENHLFNYDKNVSDTMSEMAFFLIQSSRRLVGLYSNQNRTPSQWASARGLAMSDLESVKRILGTDSSGEMKPLWIDRGVKKETKMYAKRLESRKVRVNR
ncbi:hypothetical protein EDC01DRAFT_676709 [Geopyxis carbonaria]|nr:hypothetical protein EDC01DRAFT_676709 [Geopyxis carbonaria]